MLTWLAYTHLVPPHILCQAKNIISLKQWVVVFSWLWHFNESDWNDSPRCTLWIVCQCKSKIGGSEFCKAASLRRKFLATSLWCTFSADLGCITNFTIWEKSSHLKLPSFSIKSIICFVESLSESWCCLIIWIMSFPSSAHVQKGEGALWWEGKPHQTQQTTAHHNSQCPPAAAGTLVEIFKKSVKVSKIFSG